MDKLRIGFDAKRAFYNTRGLGNYSRDLIRIVSTGSPEDEMYLFTPKTSNSIPFHRGNNCTIVQPTSFAYTKFPAAWRTWGCNKEIKDLHLDVYHGLSHELPFGIDKTGAYTVVSMHDVIFLRHPEWFPFFDRYSFRFKYVNSCKRADHVVAISEATKADIVETIGIDESKISVVYQGCNAIYYQPVSNEQKEDIRKKYNLPHEFIMTVSAIEERKNHLCILRALSMMKHPVPYVIIGSGATYKKVLEKEIAALKIEKLVHFIENIPIQDLAIIHHCASLMVYPSFYEGYGRPIVEAQACQLPVITSQGSCFQEVGGNGAVYLNPNEPEEWAFTIDQLLSESMLTSRMISYANDNLARFTEENILHQLKKIYTKKK